MDARIEAKLRPGTDYHPLQIVPFFRRWKPSQLRNILLTAIMCGVIVALIVLTIAAFGGRLTWNRVQEIAIFALAIGYVQHFLYTLVIATARRKRSWAPLLMHPLTLSLLVPVVGIYVGFMVALAVMSGAVRLFTFHDGWREFVFSACIAVAIGWVLWEATEANRLREVSRRERAELEAAAALSDKERATAELKTLRAQVEPHFLYNTLSNVASLIDREPATAKHMTERLIGYLRHTLDASRRDNATVGDELAIVSDYLEILRLRMGERLAFSIDVTDEVRAIPMSPMLLQPLVENAIKHGLEPKIEGGSIAVAAAVHESILQIRITDTGLGFGVATDTAGSGSGLANVRARLKALYGDAAKLTIEQPTEGTRICISLPITTEP
ncbi:MAG: histidine kinase [Rhizobacter sp.]|nr:histidine kinase [Burkholderiales bacterium]